MKRLFLKGGLLCILSFVACLAWAEDTDTDNLTAYWDWENNKPEGIQSFSGFEGQSGDIESSISGIYLHVDATSGKLGPNNGTPQFTTGAKLQVPVASTSDVVTFKGYSGLSYTIGGGEQKSSTGSEDAYTATDADVAQGYVEIVSYSSGYMYSVKATYASEDEINSLKDTSVTATWDWNQGIPDGLFAATIFDVDGETKSGYLDSDLTVGEKTVQLYVDASMSGGKLSTSGRTNDVQYNKNTIIHVPVVSTEDVVTVTGYPNTQYSHYSIAGVTATDIVTSYTAVQSDVELGYVEIVATDDNCYLYSITVKFASSDEIANIKEDLSTQAGGNTGGDDEGDDEEEDENGVKVEKALYTTSFTEWPEINGQQNYTTPTENTVTTRYSDESLTFELCGVSVVPDGKDDSKFPGYVGYMMTQKTSYIANNEPYATTSKLKSITKIQLTQTATGNSRGIKVSVKGTQEDGTEDTDWVVLHDTAIQTAGGEDLELTVNRKKCQIKFENISEGMDQNAYVTDLAIYGNVTLSGPALDSLFVNETGYDAYDVFTESDGQMVGTIYISQAASYPSESDNPVTATADNGTVKSISYTNDGATVTIEVATEDSTLTYVLNIERKPMCTLTYIGLDGTELGTQEVEQDATIGTFNDYTSSISPDDGYTFRGWFVSADGGKKYSESDVITESVNLYAVATETEVQSTTAQYSFDLTDQYFYAEDHEAFNPTGSGVWHDATHGWVFGNGDTIDLLVGGDAYILLDLCQYSSDGTTISLDDNSIDAKVSSDGASASFAYTGEAGTITLTISGGTVYIHNLTIINVVDNPVAKNDAGYYVVNAGDADNLLLTLQIANATASSDERTYIFLPNGTYDLGNATLTKISGANISLIGQSMDSTIIVNEALEESINESATLLVTGDNCYMQDLTLENDYPYYTYDNGRAVCLWDQANHTICKNVKMLSYQDTYYSNNATAEKYFETSDIHGTVDFICGDGAVYFQNCTITVEKRTNAGSGECTITAPNTATSATYGYVFNGCTIDNYAAKYNYGRAWSNGPRCVFLNTILNDPDNINENRWNTTGINTVPTEFLEYNTMNSDLTSIMPESNTITFSGGSSTLELNTLMTSETDAKKYELATVFSSSSWTPNTCTVQLEMGDVISQNETTDEDTEETTPASISWDVVDNALAYAIFKDGEFVEIIDGSSTSYEVTEDGTYTVRAANSYGGFGESSEDADITTIIKDAAANTGNIVNTVYYNLSGVRVSNAYKGVVIKVETMENGKQVTTKVIK